MVLDVGVDAGLFGIVLRNREIPTPTTEVWSSRALFWQARHRGTSVEVPVPQEDSPAGAPLASAVVAAPPDPEVECVEV